MQSNTSSEIIFSIVLIILTALFLDPFMLNMPHSLVNVLIAGVVIVFAVFAGLIWKERARDERDELHRMIASRVGYLFGSGVLVLGLVWQTIFSHPDPWLVTALVVMVLAKLFGFAYTSSKN